MPVINFQISKLTKTQKEEIAKGFTEVASRVTGISEAGFYVFIQEYELDNVGVSGTLLSNKGKDE